MESAARFSGYDDFAWVYNRQWGPKFSKLWFSIMESLLLKDLPAGAHVLDVCCGTGHLAALLVERGYRVTGVDASDQMLRFARENAPNAEFVLDDARSFKRPEAFDAAVSTFDSLNHIMRIEELTAVFRNVHASLRANGMFLFDLNTEKNYKEQWHGSFGIVEEDHACVVQSSYCAADRTALFRATLFIKRDARARRNFRENGRARRSFSEGGWQRSDVTLTQRWHPDDEVRAALSAAGFGKVSAYEHSRERGIEPLTATASRAFYLCRKCTVVI